MILQEQGKLSYDQSLKDLFPDFPAYGEKITIRHLLQHTSGLIDYESLIPDTATVQVLDEDVLEMMKGVDSTYFEPGTQYRYSNSAYAVLAMIIEKVSGLKFANFLDKYIFTPAGMKHSVAFEIGISTVPNRALGYTVKGDTVIDSDQSITSAVLGDGGIYSSVKDLYYWDQILYTDSLVTKASLERAFTPLVLPDGTYEIYGFGWRIDTYKGHTRIHHIGSTSGFRSVIQRYPEDSLTVIILANRSEPDLFPLATRITDLYL
jgi:CubicO group peptidase (beta-lactamase class C family)